MGSLISCEDEGPIEEPFGRRAYGGCIDDSGNFLDCPAGFTNGCKGFIDQVPASAHIAPEGDEVREVYSSGIVVRQVHWSLQGC